MQEKRKNSAPKDQTGLRFLFFYQTGFPRKAWENNDKICVIIRYSVGPNGLISPDERFQIHLLSDLCGEINISLYFKAGD